MVVVFQILVLAPALLWTRGRKDVSGPGLAAVFIYYIIASYFVELIASTANPWFKAAGITTLLGAPVLVIYRESLRAVLASLTASFLLLSILFHWYSVDKPYVPPVKAKVRLERPADITAALRMLKNQQHDREAVVNAVLYLREVSGLQIGNEPTRWEQWYQGTGRVQISRKAASREAEPELIRDGFSAVKALNYFRLSQETGEDFLGLFIGNVLPDRITPRHLQLLKEAADRLQGEKFSTNRPQMFRRGMAYFFLALAETLALAQGDNLDVTTINSHWDEALTSLTDSEIGRPMAQSLEAALKEADVNGDNRWIKEEFELLMREAQTAPK